MNPAEEGRIFHALVQMPIAKGSMGLDGGEFIALSIFNFGTRWRWVVSYIPESLNTRVSNLKKPSDRRMARFEIRYAGFEEEKYILPRLEWNPDSLVVQLTY